MTQKIDIKPFLETALSRISIAEVFHQHGASLRRSGEDYVACCPFHVEKTPSCHLYTKQNRYHCFGCGAHGDALTFLMQYDGQSFRESVIALADATGVVLPEAFVRVAPCKGLSAAHEAEHAGGLAPHKGFGGGLRPLRGASPLQGSASGAGAADRASHLQGDPFSGARQKSPRKMREPRAWEGPPPPTSKEIARCQELTREAAGIYQKNLTHPSAQKALQDRGITASAIERFSLGYADGSSSVLQSIRQKAGGEAEWLAAYEQAGLVVQKGSDKAWADRFRHRLIFPIRDVAGAFCGMGGRYIAPPENGFGKPSSVRPKYINTPDTPAYHKNQMLYGLHENWSAIQSARHVFLVEGYMDVIGLCQAGIENVVASCGTALTDAQLQLLLQHTSSITFCFDGDAPGREAALKAARKSVEYLQDHVRIRVMFLPADHDPDSLMRSPNGADLFDKLACDAVSVLDVLMDSLLGQPPAGGHTLARGQTIAREQPLAARRPDAQHVDAFLKEWSYYLERIPGDAVRGGWESVVASMLGMANLSVPLQGATPAADREGSVTPASSSQRQPRRGEPVSCVAHMPQALSEKVVTRALWWIYRCEGTEWQELWRAIPATCLIYEARRSTPARALYMVLRSLAEGLSLADTRTGRVLDILKKVEAQKDFVSIVRDMSDAAKQQEVSAMVARISRQAVQGRVAYVAWMADTYGEWALSDEERSLLRMRSG